jgi:hypothetical protein
MKYGAGKVVKGKKQSLHKKRKNEIIWGIEKGKS